MIKALHALLVEPTFPIYWREQNRRLLHLEIYEIKPHTTLAFSITFLAV